MVKKIQEKEEVLYQCEECEFKYRDKDTAQKCEAWCSEHNSCNLDITKDAVL